MLCAEFCIVGLVFALALLWPSTDWRWVSAIEHSLAQLARRRGLAILLAGGTALALRLAVLPILPMPYPSITDEFSYQLSADTFAHGRLANPTHPMWVHLECPNVIQQPTYSSMYYPAQGAFMALGEVIGKHPFWGVWLSVGFMCAALCWMLQAWVSPLWALIGALLAALRLGTFSYWNDSYFGGAVTALGGALVLGALPRIKRSLKVRDVLLMGLGLALLFNSRPYESLFFSVPIIAALALFSWRSIKIRPQVYLFRFALPSTLVLVATAAFMAYFFWRTTGHPLLAPYVVNLRTYAVEPNFAWLPLRPTPHYHTEMIRRYWTEWDVGTYEAVRAHPIVSTAFKIFMFWLFYLGPLLSIPFVALLIARWRGFSLNMWNPKFRFLLLVCGATLIGVLLVVPLTPLYLAPATAAIYGMLMIAMQRLRRWQIANRYPGIFCVRAVSIGALLLLLLRIAIPVFHIPITNPRGSWTWSSQWDQLLSRHKIQEQLEATPGKHLVIVHYGPQHNPKEGWCSNSADIDGSKIVWATDMGPMQNEELIRYFNRRRGWLVDPDKIPVQLQPYGETNVTTGRAPDQSKIMNSSILR